MQLYEAIEAFLAPIIGQHVAHRLILNFCAHRNMQPSEIQAEHLGMLGAYLRENLKIFVGSENAEHVFNSLLNSRITV